MAETHRRLAAIVAADVIGYSRLVGRDEKGALASLRSRSSNSIDPYINTHRGRVTDSADGVKNMLAK